MESLWQRIVADLRTSLTIETDRITTTQAWLLALLAWSFGVAVRYFYPAIALENPANLLAGLPTIHNSDGYYFAHEANKLLLDHPHGSWEIVFSPNHALSTLVWLLVTITPWNIETVIYYLPVWIAPLVAFPVVFIGRALGNTWMGWLSALLISITWSYYNRSMAGYFDTDLWVITYPLLLALALLRLLDAPTLSRALLVGVMQSCYWFIYGQAIFVSQAMILIALVLLYGSRIYHQQATTRTSDTLPAPELLIVLTPAMLQAWNGWWWLNAALCLLAWVGLKFINLPTHLSLRRRWILALAIFTIALLLSPIVWRLWPQLAAYIFRGVLDDGDLWHYYSVSGTIREAGNIPLSVFANRVSGSIPGLLCAIPGMLLLLLRHPRIGILLPMVTVGFFALIGGLRFTIYLIPLASFGCIFLLLLIARRIRPVYLARSAIVAAFAALLTPNLLHVREYFPYPAITQPEASVLQNLGSRYAAGDYLVSWWDYGYEMRFYSGLDTIIDGGAHNNDNFIISKILSGTSPAQAAHLMREAAEIHADHYARTQNRGGSIVSATLFGDRQHKPIDPHALLGQMSAADYSLQYPKEREALLYLPARMLNIVGTVRLFSDLDLHSGAQRRQIYRQYEHFRREEGRIILPGGIIFNKRTGILKQGDHTQKIRAFYTVNQDQQQRLRTQSQIFHTQENLSIIDLRPLGKILVLSNLVLRSNFIQMYLFGRYDPNYFEPLHQDKWVAVYRLKI